MDSSAGGGVSCCRGHGAAMLSARCSRDSARAQVRELQRQHVVAALRQPAYGPNESILTVSSEQIERGGPLCRREHFHPFAVRLPVAGGLVIDALDKVVTHDEIGCDRRRVLTQ